MAISSFTDIQDKINGSERMFGNYVIQNNGVWLRYGQEGNFALIRLSTRKREVKIRREALVETPIFSTSNYFL